ncbi:MAG: 16S rRNA (guanine(966)-N(2))-methyltransferase RsmD [Verrucomicrobiae bacterium]|jgi:16S rRNA (guanine966-N2)-methyltransferase|nr:16S rRNA (guanine(966)-N(2))-methyltransferase RsmD [Verrucomicrobiae bacterium]
MRVIAGSAKGILLKKPTSFLRPTMDRVRAAIFSILGERVPYASVLDLFSGTGAMGIEALSRGAADATLVDNNTRSIEAIKNNLTTTRLKAQVEHMDSLAYLKRISGAFVFDLIFADPPYADDQGNNLAASLLESPFLIGAMAPEALFILECEHKQSLPGICGLEILIDRTYGATRILIMKKNEGVTSKK